MSQKFRSWQRPPMAYDENWATWVTSALNSLVTSAVTLKTGSKTGDYSTTSTTYVDVDATNLAFTVTIPAGWKLVVLASGLAYTNTAAVNAQVSLFDSATLLEHSFTPSGVGATFPLPFCLSTVIAGDGNSHTIKLRFKTTNAADAVSIVNRSATLLPTMVFQLVQSN